MFRENPHYNYFSSLRRSFYSPLGQLPFLVAYFLSGSWDSVLDSLEWEENFNEEFPKKLVIHWLELFTLLALSLSSTRFGLIILRTFGSVWHLWAWQLTLHSLPVSLPGPDMVLNGACGIQWPRLVRSLCGPKKVFFTVLRRLNCSVLGHWRWLNRRGRRRIECVLSTQTPAGSCLAQWVTKYFWRHSLCLLVC